MAIAINMRISYNIKITSRNLYLFFLLISLLIGTIGPTYLLSISGYKFSTAFNCLVDLTIVFFLIYLSTPMAKKNAFVVVEEKLLIINLPPFIFRKRISVFEIPWNELENFLIEPNPHLTKVKFNLKGGKKIMFFHDATDSKRDDFIAFEMILYKKIFNINKERKSEVIVQQQTIYESRLGQLLAIFLAIALLIIPFAYTIRHVTPPLGYLLVLYSGGFYFIWMVYKSKIQ